MKQPRLLPVPNQYHNLTIKADLNGITILKEGRFRKRYTGSRQYAVDINGYFRTTKELKSILEGEAKKSGPPAKKAPKLTNPLNPEDTKKIIRTYSINKPEIRQRIFGFINSQRGPRELYFWTVTFPMLSADAAIYKIFNTWLTTLRQNKWLRNYLWVAERQGNGTLHFHLAIPHKMSVVAANRAMRTILANASRRGEIDHSPYLCKRYNGVDISKNRKEKRVTNFALGKRGQRALISYISKYITKNNGKFTHLAWHNSRGFSALFTGVTFTVDEFQNVYSLVGFVRRHSAFKNDFFMYFPWKTGPPDKLVGELRKLNYFIQDLQNLN